MARTAHHLHPHRPWRTNPPAPGAWHTVVLFELRYSAADFSAASRAGRRPTPVRVVHRVDVYTFPRHQRDRTVGTEARWQERRARQRLRTARVALLRAVNTTGGMRVEAADEVAVPTAKHRRCAIWLA
ncbi:hypothetical protein [uncultured Streptomyces sp.]|uniref:hypothetical protein n=1 Tax=uncultured Streptomyces sp. TaxID=174707 RepID=UPI00262585B9|nr:hypothetical protein [uncultured Streptomyces sp.]